MNALSTADGVASGVGVCGAVGSGASSPSVFRFFGMWTSLSNWTW